MDKDKEEERKEKISHHRKNFCIRETDGMYIAEGALRKRMDSI